MSEIRPREITECLGRIRQIGILLVENRPALHGARFGELDQSLLELGEHHAFWMGCTASRPGTVILDPDGASQMGQLKGRLERADRANPAMVEAIARQAIDLSFNFIGALPGDPTIDPPRPRPRPRP